MSQERKLKMGGQYDIEGNSTYDIFNILKTDFTVNEFAEQFKCSCLKYMHILVFAHSHANDPR